MKTLIIVLSILSVSSLASAGEKSGGGGTDGGADYTLTAFALMPDRLTVHTEHDYPLGVPNIYLGMRPCFQNVLSCKTWAHLITVDREFDKSRFSDHDAGTQLYVWAKYRRDFALIENLIREPLVPAAEGCYQTSSKWNICGFTLRYLNKVSLPKEAFIEYVKGNHSERMDTYTLVERLNRDSDVILNQLDFTDLRSVQSAFAWNRFLKGLAYPNIQKKIEDALLDRIIGEAAAFKAFAQVVIDQNGNCDHERYDELTVKLKAWRFGSDRFFYQLKRKANGELSEATEKQALEIRRDLKWSISDSVVPFCEPDEKEGFARFDQIFEE